MGFYRIGASLPSPYLRRGKKTDAVFQLAKAARLHTTSYVAGPESFRTRERHQSISVAQARHLFQTNKRARMKRRSDNSYAFTVTSHYGVDRVYLHL